ncbi:N-acetylglucosamine kinase [Guptibacillus algicola]|uniref:N-acetylglucosamine kinase n=1 Tax=Guptibacillus algicola TaxID=225844 RepID=UPI001CD5AB1A|nr:BadF/BadG/BcrA/BcrD ATPase family protein [Alkalihalobacillus algicola]MCA0986925.1 hypothetical protein [Alkalihalobacillus algicola]
MYYIGIDGGGTKTEAFLCDHDGRLIAKGVAGSTNIKSRSVEEVRKEIQQVMKALTCNLVKPEIEAIYVSTAGGDRVEDQERWKTWLLESLPEFSGMITVTNDAYGAIASGTFSLEGTVLIAGTGSIAYSISRNKPSIRAGGWGYLFGDGGSGYAIGRQALNVLTEMHDNIREKDEAFVRSMLSFLTLKNASEIITSIYEDGYPRLKIASLAKCVIMLGEQHNPIALRILDDACEALLKLVKVVHDDTKSIVLCGGLFQSELFRETFERKLEKSFAKLKVIYPELSPAVGACICALLTNSLITERMKKNLTSSYNKIEDSYT